MRVPKNSLILLVSLILSLLPYAYATAAVESDTAIQNEILVHINAYRQHRGLSKLTMDNRIVQQAKQHSIDMATHRMSFGHKHFEKRIATLHSQIKNSGAGAENVAYNYKNARIVVEQWIRSSGHQRNIVGNYNLTGIGIARDKQGKIYFTQMFLRTGESARYVARRPYFGVGFRRGA
ncbi:MAG: CAP domain-containing protein [Legionella sp.]|nr:CAP domain-containing protein [Legionella sp.]